MNRKCCTICLGYVIGQYSVLVELHYERKKKRKNKHQWDEVYDRERIGSRREGEVSWTSGDNHINFPCN